MTSLSDLRRQFENEHTELGKLRAVEKAARRLIKEGLRLTKAGLVVCENDDNSDPHYERCEALEAIEPLNSRYPNIR